MNFRLLFNVAQCYNDVKLIRGFRLEGVGKVDFVVKNKFMITLRCHTKAAKI